MDEAQYFKCEILGAHILELFEAGAWKAALDTWEVVNLDADERVWCWQYFDSRQRAWLKGDDRKYIDGYLERT